MVSPANDSERGVIPVFIFARMDSRRLPGKALAPIAGKPLLGWMIDRLSGFRVVVLTTHREGDTPIADYAQAHGASVFRGDLDPVSRAQQACAHLDVPTFARVCGDSPFISPELVGALIEIHKPDMTTRVSRGQSVEVIEGHLFDDIPIDYHGREHLTMWFYEHHTRYRINSPRLTVDTPADLEMANRLAKCFG